LEPRGSQGLSFLIGNSGCGNPGQKTGPTGSKRGRLPQSFLPVNHSKKKKKKKKTKVRQRNQWDAENERCVLLEKRAFERRGTEEEKIRKGGKKQLTRKKDAPTPIKSVKKERGGGKRRFERRRNRLPAV